MTNDDGFLDLDIREIRDWQKTRVYDLIVFSLKNMEKQTHDSRLSREYVTQDGGQLKLNYLLGYADAIEHVLDLLKFDLVEETNNDED